MLYCAVSIRRGWPSFFITPVFGPIGGAEVDSVIGSADHRLLTAHSDGSTTHENRQEHNRSVKPFSLDDAVVHRAKPSYAGNVRVVRCLST
jgi:hypothetical protein